MGTGEIPEGTVCNWCGDYATRSFEIKRRIKGARAGANWGTGQFWYACEKHYGSAERMLAEPMPSLRKQR